MDLGVAEVDAVVVWNVAGFVDRQGQSLTTSLVGKGHAHATALDDRRMGKIRLQSYIHRQTDI